MPKINFKNIGLANKILIGMVAGLIIGFAAPEFGQSLQQPGLIFMKLLQMAVVPLIFANVVYGIAQMDDVRNFGNVGGKLLVYYMATTLVAALIGVFVAQFFNLGDGFPIDPNLLDKNAAPQTMSGFWDTLNAFIPKNIIDSMANTKLPQVILFAIFTGIAILSLEKDRKTRMVGAFHDMSKLMLRIIMMVMALAPYGIAALMAWTAGKYGLDIFVEFGKFFASIFTALLIQIFCVYLMLIVLITKLNPWTYLNKVKPIMLTAFTLCSSAATVPVSLKVTEEDMGLPTKVTNFSIPLGATMNMDGNAIWFGTIGIFAAHMAGIDVTFAMMLSYSVMGVLLTIGTPGIPGGIFVSTAIFLSAFNLPLEAGAMMIGIFRIIDMGITSTNCLGDVTGATIVSKLEKLFDPKTSEQWKS